MANLLARLAVAGYIRATEAVQRCCARGFGAYGPDASHLQGGAGGGGGGSSSQCERKDVLNSTKSAHAQNTLPVGGKTTTPCRSTVDELPTTECIYDNRHICGFLWVTCLCVIS